MMHWHALEIYPCPPAAARLATTAPKEVDDLASRRTSAPRLNRFGSYEVVVAGASGAVYAVRLEMVMTTLLVSVTYVVVGMSVIVTVTVEHHDMVQYSCAGEYAEYGTMSEYGAMLQKLLPPWTPATASARTAVIAPRVSMIHCRSGTRASEERVEG